MAKATFNTDYISKLNEHPDYKGATVEQVAKGGQLAEIVQEGDRPEEYLDPKDLYCLSAFYEYKAIETQQQLLADDEDDYPWPGEELQFQDEEY